MSIFKQNINLMCMEAETTMRTVAMVCHGFLPIVPYCFNDTLDVLLSSIYEARVPLEGIAKSAP